MFDALCDQIRCNHPSIVSVKGADGFPLGYGQQLGNALQHNTHVSYIELYLSKLLFNLIQDDPVQHLGTLFHYIQHSSSLHEVHITAECDSLYLRHRSRNNSDVETHATPSHQQLQASYDVVQKLYEIALLSIAMNPAIHAFRLAGHIDFPWSAFTYLMLPSSMSSSSLSSDNSTVDDYSKLNRWTTDDTTTNRSSTTPPILSSPLTTSTTTATTTTRQNREKASIRSISMVLSRWGATACGASLAQSLNRNTSLICLDIQIFHDTHIIDTMLHHLGHHTSLQELKLYIPQSTTIGHMNALHQFLQTTKTLRHLELGVYKLDQQRWMILCESLNQNQTLRKLSFLMCTFDACATVAFTKYMQSTTTTTTVRELSFRGHGVVFVNTYLGRVMSAILTPPSPPSQKSTDTDSGTTTSTHVRSLGCSLQSLEIDLGHGCFLDEMVRTIATHANSIYLQSLTMGSYRHTVSTWRAIARCVPKLCHMTHLDIREHHNNINSVVHNNTNNHNNNRSHQQRLPILRALRKNGCLHSISLPQQHCRNNQDNNLHHRKENNNNNDAETRYVRAICQRNQILPKLLTNGAENIGDTREECPKDDMYHKTNNLALYPMLFHGAKPARGTAPHCILIGLLSMGESVPRCSAVVVDDDSSAEVNNKKRRRRLLMLHNNNHPKRSSTRIRRLPTRYPGC